VVRVFRHSDAEDRFLTVKSGAYARGLAKRRKASLRYGAIRDRAVTSRRAGVMDLRDDSPSAKTSAFTSRATAGIDKFRREA
jgi:hypothetical protein